MSALLPVLGCVLMMPAMMWMMSRGRGAKQEPPERSRQQEIEALREEVAALRRDTPTDEPASVRSTDNRPGGNDWPRSAGSP
jgi:hypothetical protein